MTDDADHGYRLLFSQPQMVRDLLTGFVREDWVDQLDFDTLERVNATYVAEDLREREDDIIWRVRWGEDWLYVYLLLEFQSRVERFMAVRIMTYVGLLYQDLIRQQTLTASRLLPPVLPIVLYNGERRWRAATDIEPLIERVPGGLEHYRPQCRYLLLDEGAIVADPEWSDELRNVAGALFRLEHSRDEQDLLAVLERLVGWLKAPRQAALRRAFVVWMRRVLLPQRAPEGFDLPEIDQLQDLHEVHHMLAERMKKWPQRWEERGIEKGREEGREKGFREGRQEGRQEGREETCREMARNLIRLGALSDAQIATVTELAEDEIRALREQDAH